MCIPDITKLFDIHGVVRGLRIPNDLRNALLFEAHERLAVLNSDLVIVVSEAMKNYLHKKYRERLRTSIVIFPMSVMCSGHPRKPLDGRTLMANRRSSTRVGCRSGTERR